MRPLFGLKRVATEPNPTRGGRWIADRQLPSQKQLRAGASPLTPSLAMKWNSLSRSTSFTGHVTEKILLQVIQLLKKSDG